jgi:tetratricopeptide (TPR) repeat protein
MEAALNVRSNANDHLEFISTLDEWQTTTLDKQAIPATSMEALLLKEKGNEYFKLAKYPESVKCYSASLKCIPRLDIVLLNRAQSYLKIDEFKRAEQDCSDYILACGDRNIKAFWRRASARSKSGDLEGARADLERALVLEPTNKKLKQELLVYMNYPSFSYLKKRICQRANDVFQSARLERRLIILKRTRRRRRKFR